MLCGWFVTDLMEPIANGTRNNYSGVHTRRYSFYTTAVHCIQLLLSSLLFFCLFYVVVVLLLLLLWLLMMMPARDSLWGPLSRRDGRDVLQFTAAPAVMTQLRGVCVTPLRSTARNNRAIYLLVLLLWPIARTQPLLLLLLRWWYYAAV